MIHVDRQLIVNEAGGTTPSLVVYLDAHEQPGGFVIANVHLSEVDDLIAKLYEAKAELGRLNDVAREGRIKHVPSENEDT